MLDTLLQPYNINPYMTFFLGSLDKVGILQPYHIHGIYYIHSLVYLMCWIHYYNLTILTLYVFNSLLAIYMILQPYYIHSFIYLMCWMQYYNLTILQHFFITFPSKDDIWSDYNITLLAFIFSTLLYAFSLTSITIPYNIAYLHTSFHPEWMLHC